MPRNATSDRRWDPMVTSVERSTTRRKGVLILRIAAVVVVGGLGLAWAATRPSLSKACTVAAAIDEVGAATPGAARVRWAAQYPLEVDVEQPDRVNGSGDRITATYLLDRPDLDPSRIAFQEIVTERGDDGVWRVASANECEEWTSS
jgi:hypothetical protein